MDTQLKKGILELIILKHLRDKDCYAYELNKIINKVIEINESTSYAILKKMINKGYCDFYMLDSDGNYPARKYYKITDLGREELTKNIKAWEEFQSNINDLLK
ncbi:PadR family transcriptional regulator, regulatory protein PadR [Spiroplasma sabaudiense Ar-1343]|uniref:PadR family transcriptional regulator, regulatory protein PadR n=1 Tax=Spiroplasma sabaudiense Ar-1343 TaxID=1276257 RepID=W6A9N0_9MOLU|nr:PadR family transcriptional regulator [Spiroplasma sabaudiense]AHI53595.1 PadR family transcriptional regulator, regulatory protein PadR [Spiroplasma sabaudiense Ar-1343]